LLENKEKIVSNGKTDTRQVEEPLAASRL